MPNLSLVSDEVMQKMVKKVLQLFLKHFDTEERLKFIESTPC